MFDAKKLYRFWLLAVMVCFSSLISVPVTAQSAVKPVVIDVRTPQEFADKHLKGAINIEYQDISAKIASVTPDKNAPIELYCRSGQRASVAEESLRKLGYTHVTNMGGLDGLVKQGKPIE